MLNIFASKEERDEKKLRKIMERRERKFQEEQNRRESAIRRANLIQDIFLKKDLIDKACFISPDKHEMPSNIWIPLRVFADKGVVYVEFSSSSRLIRLTWKTIQNQVFLGTDEEVIDHIFVKGRNEYLQIQKDLLWVKEWEDTVPALRKRLWPEKY